MKSLFVTALVLVFTVKSFGGQCKQLTDQDLLQRAQELNRQAVEINDYRFANWKALTPEQREKYNITAWTLLNESSALLTKVVGIHTTGEKYFDCQ